MLNREHMGLEEQGAGCAIRVSDDVAAGAADAAVGAAVAAVAAAAGWLLLLLAGFCCCCGCFCCCYCRSFIISSEPREVSTEDHCRTDFPPVRRPHTVGPVAWHNTHPILSYGFPTALTDLFTCFAIALR